MYIIENVQIQLQETVASMREKAIKSDAENKSKDNQIISLQDEISQREAANSKLCKEKKRVEEELTAANESLADMAGKIEFLARSKLDLEAEVETVEANWDREKRARADLDKAKRKLEADLKAMQEENGKVLKQKSQLEEDGKS
jgi:chromosome segregation ATPase